MGIEINLLDLYPTSKRPIADRGRTITDADRALARQYGKSFFDGDRLEGYGGYSYHPRFWTDTVRRIRDHYGLAPDARILDVGCAKGFTLHDFKVLMPQADIRGIDISTYAIENAKEEVRPFLQRGDAKNLPFEDKSFDLVLSINTVHNLPRAECTVALQEIERVCRGNAFVTVDAWRTEAERAALEQWILTAYTYMHVDDWVAFFKEAGYTGDYYWFIAASA